MDKIEKFIAAMKKKQRQKKKSEKIILGSGFKRKIRNKRQTKGSGLKNKKIKKEVEKKNRVIKTVPTIKGSGKLKSRKTQNKKKC